MASQQEQHHQNSGDGDNVHLAKEMEASPLLPENKEPSLTKEDATDGYLLIPLCERSIMTRLDIGPFLLGYLLLVYILDFADLPDSLQDTILFHWFSQLAFPTVLSGHITLFLLQQWNVFWRATVGFRKMSMSSMNQWTHCLVEAPHVDKHHSSHNAGIVSVNISRDGVAVVNFQDVIFHCSNKESDTDSTLWSSSEDDQNDIIVEPKRVETTKQQYTLLFHRLRYPIHLSLSFYRKWRGHSTIPKVVEAQQVYGTNTTPIELPPFFELLQEQVVAPFFLFQVLCVLLWSLDEYWYYALFTFFALLMFESTVAYNRLQALQRLRSHTDNHQNRPIWVYRPSYPPGMNDWIKISVAEIVPGDVVSCRRVTATRANQETEQRLNRVPADILILGGDAVVDEALLTGESIPQLKVALEDSQNGLLDLQEHKQFILFGGTTLLVSHPGTADTGIPVAPDQGVIGMVLRTGFETAQGSLLRTMAHTQKSVDGIHTKDTYVFILLLLCCAIASASMVWTEGWNDPARNRFRLVLHVIIIITSVVPPELPMELSLAVTNSVADLMKRCRIYCTEVFRIPLAGQVDICCFDKTGTLTSDEMLLKGIRYVGEANELSDVMEPGDHLPWPVARTMVACHSLALNGASGRGKFSMSSVIGDPLEKAVLKDTGYRLLQNNALRAKESAPGRPNTILILSRFGFTSQLKRMSVLVREDSSSKTWVLTKGAPETIKQFLKPQSIPSNYDAISKHHMALGQRVLAMAYREVGTSEISGSLKEVKREAVECNLIFAGFLLLHCPVKPDSKSVISELQMSGHQVVMITGDAMLTAAEVARQVRIIQKQGTAFPPVYQLEQLPMAREKTGYGDFLTDFAFVPLFEKGSGVHKLPDKLPLTRSGLKVLQKIVAERKVALCISGDILQKVVLSFVGKETSELGCSAPTKKDEKQILFHPAAQAALKEIVPLISVFARHAPRQKEAVIAAFNLGGFNTLMCGDGTNDVGALRRAHVGISIISAPEVEAKQRSATEAISQCKAQQKKERRERKKKGAAIGSTRSKSTSALQESLRKLQEAQEELDNVELGDASIASPFTSRTASIKCCKDVLQTGRCTMVTMLQIYKILGVNCLVNAMVLSKLFLHGVKQGDRQLTILGFAVAALFFFVTRGQPLPSLSPSKPPSSVLCVQTLLSIALQFFLHFGTILLVTEIALSFVDPYDPSMIPDGPFNPNTLNTCTFLMSVLATVNTFAVNYRGEPFVEPLTKNKMLLRTLQVCYGVLLVCALEAFPPLGDLLQLTEFPNTTITDESVSWRTKGYESTLILSTMSDLVETIGFQAFMCGLMILNTIAAFAIESCILRIFEPAKA